MKKSLLMLCVIFAGVLFLPVIGFGQNTYVPNGTPLNSNSTYMGIGTTTPSAKFHLQQSGGGWNDGIRLSLLNKHWDIVSDVNGDRLAFSNGQNSSNAVFMHAAGTGPTLQVNGSLSVFGPVYSNEFWMTSGDNQTNFTIQKPATFNDPFRITLGKSNISGGIMIGRADWLSKVLIPWNVALGEASPTARFHIQQRSQGWGDGIRLSYLEKNWDVVVDGGGDRFIIAKGQDANNGIVISNGNVGVGIGAPSRKLHVAGSILADGLEVIGDATVASVNMKSNDGQTAFYIAKPTASGKPFTIGLGYQDIQGGIMIGREDWISKVMFPWKVAIGTTTPAPGAYLTVDGNIVCEEIKVEIIPGTGPDYVFEEDYDLLSLAELEAYVKQNKHLPEVPSAKQMDEEGLNLKEMNLILLKKVEELTLHLIEMKKQIEALEKK